MFAVTSLFRAQGLQLSWGSGISEEMLAERRQICSKGHSGAMGILPWLNITDSLSLGLGQIWYQFRSYPVIGACYLTFHLQISCCYYGIIAGLLAISPTAF